MKNHNVYFIFHQTGSHNMPLNKPLKIQFETWTSCIQFIRSGYVEKEGGSILAITGHKKPQLNPVMKKELQKELPNADGALVVELLYSPQGMHLRSAVNN